VEVSGVEPMIKIMICFSRGNVLKEYHDDFRFQAVHDIRTYSA